MPPYLTSGLKTGSYVWPSSTLSAREVARGVVSCLIKRGSPNIYLKNWLETIRNQKKGNLEGWKTRLGSFDWYIMPKTAPKQLENHLFYCNFVKVKIEENLGLFMWIFLKFWVSWMVLKMFLTYLHVSMLTYLKNKQKN